VFTFCCALATGKYLHADNILQYGEKNISELWENYSEGSTKVQVTFEEC
jgi:hypothetical protein